MQDPKQSQTVSGACALLLHRRGIHLLLPALLMLLITLVSCKAVPKPDRGEVLRQPKPKKTETVAIPEVDPDTTVYFSPGAQFVTHRTVNVATYIVDLDSELIDLHWKETDTTQYKRLGRVKTALDSNHQSISLITNAGMYHPNLAPQGLYIEDGKELVPIDSSKGPEDRFLNFYLHPNGVFFQDSTGVRITTSEQYIQSADSSVEFATQSGPMLLIDGEIHPGFNPESKHRKLRSGVGIMDSSRVVFAISDGPITFYDFATLFQERFGCKNALYLDGVISRMYMPELEMLDEGGGFGGMISVTQREQVAEITDAP